MSQLKSPLLSFICLFSIASPMALAVDCSKIPPGWEWFFAHEGHFNVGQRHAWADPRQKELNVEMHGGFRPMKAEELAPFTLYEARIDPSEHFGNGRFKLETAASRYLNQRDSFFPPVDNDGKSRFFYTDLLPPPPELRAALTVHREWCGRRLLGGPLTDGRISVLVWSAEDPSIAPFVIKWTDHPHNNFNPLSSVALSDYVEQGLRAISNPGFYLYPERFGARVWDAQEGKHIYGFTYRRLVVPGGPRLLKSEEAELIPLSVALGDKETLQRLADQEGVSIEKWKLDILLPKLASLVIDSLVKVGIMAQNHVQNVDLMIRKSPPPPGERWLFTVVIRDVRDMVVMPSLKMLLGDASNLPIFPTHRHSLYWSNEWSGNPTTEALTNVNQNSREYLGQIFSAMSESHDELRVVLSRFTEHCMERFKTITGHYPVLPNFGEEALSLLQIPPTISEAYEITPQFRDKVYDAFSNRWKNPEPRELTLRQTGLIRFAFGEVMQGIYDSLWTFFFLKVIKEYRQNAPEVDHQTVVEAFLANFTAGRFFWSSAAAKTGLNRDKLESVFDPKKAVIRGGKNVQYFLTRSDAHENAFFPAIMAFNAETTRAAALRKSDVSCASLTAETKDKAAPL